MGNSRVRRVRMEGRTIHLTDRRMRGAARTVITRCVRKSPESELWIAVIFKAAADLRGSVYRLGALRYFTSELFRVHCSLIRLRPEFVWEVLMEGCAVPSNLPSTYGGLVEEYRELAGAVDPYDEEDLYVES